MLRGTVPAEWKTAKITAILKPGKQPTRYESFRPIALLSCIGKLMEEMIFKRMNWYIESRKLYPPEMNGFRQNRSAIDTSLLLWRH